MLQLYLALTRVGNDVLSARQQIEEMVARPIRKGDRFPNQRRLSAFSGGPNIATNPFSDLDLSPLATRDGIELINQLDLLGRCYSTQIAILNDFRLQKERLFELYEQADEAAVGDAETLTFKLDRRQFGTKLEVRESQAEELANGVIEIVRRNSKLIYQTSNTYNNAASSFLAKLSLPMTSLNIVAERFPDLLESDSEIS